MSENTIVENVVHNIMESITESVHKENFDSSSSVEEISNAARAKLNRLFGRQKPIHHILGGGKSADVLLWRNKKISSSVLAGATVIWILFEWLNYHFLSLVFFVLGVGLVVQFLWSNASGYMKRSPSEVPRIQLQEEWFVDAGKFIGFEVNRALRILQDIACSGSLKMLLGVLLALFVTSIIGSYFNFLTVFYIGFVAAHTLPVLYEKYEDQVDSFVDNLLGQMQHHYKKIDTNVLSKIPVPKNLGKKNA